MLDDPQPKGLKGYLTLIAQRAKMQGFIVYVPVRTIFYHITDFLHSFDYADQYPVAVKKIAAGLADGSIKSKFHIVEGLQNAPSALPMLFSGANVGKLCVSSVFFSLYA